MRAFLILVTTFLLSSCADLFLASTGLRTFYKIEKQQVKYYQWNVVSQEFSISKLTDANAQKFKELSPHYGKDDLSVFYGSKKLTNADPNTFRLINAFIAMDSKNVYVDGKQLQNADPQTFKYHGSSWASDKNDYYFNGVKLSVCDINSFKVVEDDYPRRGYDNYCYFYQSYKVPLRDRDSLEILNGLYARDKYNVYWADRVVNNAQPSKIMVQPNRSSPLATDGKFCFSGTQIIGCADLNLNGQKFCGCDT
ncbi:hypothetical protein C2869_02960 [Saccharobesus litoralis]|uniref:DKNYY family protein n=1 Tax=Saccharobesus litoralis TaxID=2172099 RepID=A0A2S0VML4_9ALTE|nr:DKNYY domain-containing protein [Saccharobesus litoralis]AWB65458.1 hypothetical protein C2869_02960 [Saccharobesus litoralis]